MEKIEAYIFCYGRKKGDQIGGDENVKDKCDETDETEWATGWNPLNPKTRIVSMSKEEESWTKREKQKGRQNTYSIALEIL